MKTIKTIKTTKTLGLLGLACISIFASCKKKADNVAVADDNEFISKVSLRLINDSLSADAPFAIIVRKDPDDKVAPDTSKGTLYLKINSSYSGLMVLTDTTQNPTLDVSKEIKEKSVEHLFFYQPLPTTSVNPGKTSSDIPGTPVVNSGLNLRVSRTDVDANTPPLQLGLSTKLITGAASTGRLRIVLRHQPNAKNGLYEPGSSDLDYSYRVVIQ